MTREEQIDWLCRLRADLNNGVIFTPWNKEFTEALNSVLEQELKTGHNCNEDFADCDQFVCSECGIELQDWHLVEKDEDDGEISYHEFTMKYCPNCGAKMKEEE